MSMLLSRGVAKRGSVQRQPVASSNIYDGMVTRNMTDHTYTTQVDGSGVALHAPARTGPSGLDLIRGYGGNTPTFNAAAPRGALMRTNEGPVMVHTAVRGNPYAGYIATVSRSR